LREEEMQPKFYDQSSLLSSSAQIGQFAVRRRGKVGLYSELQFDQHEGQDY